MKYGLQLYTIRDEITDGESFLRALERVKEIGYDGVEFAGYHGLTAAQINAKLKELGLTALCTHEVIFRLEENLDEIIAMAKELGLKYIGMSWSPCNSPEEVQHTLRVLDKAGAEIRKHGMELVYHNHDHEFRDVEGVVPMNEISRNHCLELDTFWSTVAGKDSPKFLEAHRDQVKLIHLKDGIVAEKKPVALGEGENDIQGILHMAEKLGYEWVIVENDNPSPRGFDDITRSMKYLKANP